MCKVTIDKEWAKLIENLKSDNVSFGDVLEVYLNKAFSLNYDSMTVEKFSRAYLNGFHVEQTPQDIVEEKYKQLSQDIEDTIFHVADSPINRALGFLAGLEYVNNVMKLGLKLD